MARMTMRTREAPMEWEREQDRNLPNIFATATPQPLDSQSGTAPESFISDRGRGTQSFQQRESSFSSQGSRSSFTSEGWGSTVSRPFRQDSQAISAPASISTTTAAVVSGAGSGSGPEDASSKQRLFGLGRDRGASTTSLTRSPSPDSTSGVFANSMKTNISSFDLNALRGNIPEQQQQQRRSQIRSSLGGEGRDKGETANLKYASYNGHRSEISPSSFWNDNEDDDDSIDRSNDTDRYTDDVAGEHESQGENSQYTKLWGSTQDKRKIYARSKLNGQNQLSRRHRPQQQQQPQSQSPPPSQGRVWSENVDLPFILSGYVQVAMNAVFVVMLIYVLANFITTVQSDVDWRAKGLLERKLNQRIQCQRDYDMYHCGSGQVGPKLWDTCAELEACLDVKEHRVQRAPVAAETFAHIANAFVNTLSYKTIGFLVIIIFGGFYFSNQAMSSYRHNHLLHHQHNDVSLHPSLHPSPLKSGSENTNSITTQHASDGLKRNDTFGWDENSFLRRGETVGRLASQSSNQLVKGSFALQRHDSLRLKSDSDSDP
ncbi:Di-sulfide bridge nucleocytoplasmic transport domain-domain-containing protein [Lobosporangium transversale]|uniref:Di-sulfide bridge nucleocytoplasmic transport domain-domain-containing protein n=1 Tax=Lobosporangium transversale TaxID=64571 RepID=A0A1Y2GCC4_9FUNG|nr:Di-sulfide bridge nucleocytoplasmic transport domain-domain-containing protein [Lobosporangium transversale]ORZ04038.1 Di-sulfide bridge nucleocytoplasmic transport domain-domain-containing protein [Lobosporangium transversale]|eukprot:XP_021876315.1 Di-sulfide bridge nucleocytoplasmic transport domain-domain-containing protein [Lobosporangium transversale]